jgi:hypothetical protein
MKPKLISYSESKESVDAIGLKSWRKAGVEIELDDALPEKGFEAAKEIVRDALGSSQNENIDIGFNMSPREISAALPVINKEKDRIEMAIDNSKTKEELLTFQNDAWKYKLETQYVNKLKQLQ